MLVIGLMSGTSADGVDAALLDARVSGERVHARLRRFATTAYPPALRRRLHAVAQGDPLTARDAAVLGRELGDRFADAVLAVCRGARVAASRIALVGCHGHTVHHEPRGARTTLQIGEAAVIAARTGVTTVADFRPADVAAGGEGAPLAPRVHQWLFTDGRRGRAIQNLGGIGNVTYLPPRADGDDVIAFDTGPANTLVDGLVRRLSGGRRWFDAGGARAARGRVDSALVAELLRHRYFRASPPKSTGRELFGDVYVDALVAAGKRRRLGDDDLLATATALTAESCADAYRRFLLPRGRLDEVLVCGGGAANPTMLAMLRQALPGVRVARTDDVGVPARAVEAMAFGMLATATVAGVTGNLPSVTGARRPLVLGKVIPGTNYRRVALAPRA